MRSVVIALFILGAVLVLGFGGCRFDLPEGPSDGLRSCKVSNETCVCLMSQGVCVECTATDERNCTDPKKPQCGADNTCRACRANDDCDSGACLEDGSCATAGQVLTASPTGVNTSGCGVSGQPDCSIAQAVTELGARTIIKLTRGTYTVTGTDGVDFSQKGGTLVARDAVLVRSGTPGPLISVRNGQSLKLVGGILRGPNSADGIRCNTGGGKLQVHEAIIEQMNESGIESDSCDFTVSRSVLRKNLRGGINMVNTFKVATITNNFVYGNGQGTLSTVAGMTLKLATGSKVEFNTVVDNTADIGNTSAGGIVCDIASGAPNYDAPYNLIYRNQGGLGGTYQVYGTCTFMGSYQKAAASIDENAIFFERPNDSTNLSYRLTASSPAEVRDLDVPGYTCRDQIDFEGDARPVGDKCDAGADELRMGQ